MRQFGCGALPLLCVLPLIAVVGCGPSANGSGETDNQSVTTDSGKLEDVGSQKSTGASAPKEKAATETKAAESQAATETQAPTKTPGSAAGGVKEITFEDINLRVQADVVFRPWMLNDAVKALDGQRVRVVGFMLPDAEIRGVKEFVLLRNTECKFGPGGQADHLIMVTLKKGLDTEYRTKPISVEGVLKINPYVGTDGNTWSIYDLVETNNVKTVRR